MSDDAAINRDMLRDIAWEAVEDYNGEAENNYAIACGHPEDCAYTSKATREERLDHYLTHQPPCDGFIPETHDFEVDHNECNYEAHIAGKECIEERTPCFICGKTEAEHGDQREPIEIYGTPEHEAWLIEQERHE